MQYNIRDIVKALTDEVKVCTNCSRYRYEAFA